MFRRCCTWCLLAYDILVVLVNCLTLFLLCTNLALTTKRKVGFMLFLLFEQLVIHMCVWKYTNNVLFAILVLLVCFIDTSVRIPIYRFQSVLLTQFIRITLSLWFVLWGLLCSTAGYSFMIYRRTERDVNALKAATLFITVTVCGQKRRKLAQSCPELTSWSFW